MCFGISKCYKAWICYKMRNMVHLRPSLASTFQVLMLHKMSLVCKLHTLMLVKDTKRFDIVHLEKFLEFHLLKWYKLVHSDISGLNCQLFLSFPGPL